MNKISLLFLLASQLLSGQFENKQLDSIDIISYHFNIEINDTTNVINAKADIKFIRTKPVKTLDLNLIQKKADGYGMTVSKVLNSAHQNIKFSQENDSLHIFLPQFTKQPKDTLNIQVFYQGEPADGLYIRKNKFGKRTFFGDNWPNRPRYWLPTIDHPSDKAKVAWTITAPKHYDVVASGRRIFKISKDKTNTFYYKIKVPIPTKVMVFAAADFNIKNFEKLYLQKQCVPVSSWIYQDSPIKGFDDYKCALPILKFYDSLLGPYSFQKLANVQSNTRFGGMENAGNIFYDENTVDGTKSVENLVAHEVAHQWFGNAVTEKNWRDIWLSEGFATYLTDLYIEHNYGDEQFKKRLKKERQKIIKFNHYKHQPIVIDHPKNLFALLNPNSYEKGAWVLHMLRQKIGDKSFFNLLKEFYQTYHLKNASTEDFMHLTQQISQQNLDVFFKQWLYRDDLPKLKINTKLSKKTYLITIEQLTTPYQLDLPVVIKNKNFSIKRLLKVNKEKQTFSVDLPKINLEDAIKLIIDPDVQVLFELISDE